MTTTTLKIASNEMLYSIGFFRWVEEAIMPHDDKTAIKLLDALGIRDDLIGPILKGDYQKETEGETLILHITTAEINSDSLPTTAAEYRAVEFQDSGYGLGEDDYFDEANEFDEDEEEE
jgi:hypothetical protein